MLLGEDRRRVGSGHHRLDAGVPAQRRECRVDQGVLRPEKAAPRAAPGPRQQPGPRPERVIQRAVGDADGRTDRANGHRGGTRGDGQRLGGVEHRLRVGYARAWQMRRRRGWSRSEKRVDNADHDMSIGVVPRERCR